MPSMEDQFDEDLFTYAWDFPPALHTLASAFGIPGLNPKMPPSLQQELLIAKCMFKAPTTRRPKGIGKMIPATKEESSMETDQRKARQKTVERLVLPKSKDESPDMFIRRLAAHQEAPEAIIPTRSRSGSITSTITATAATTTANSWADSCGCAGYGSEPTL
jgi:hypothetical protein